jgi:dTDP-glucose 4,6-dehydratase
MRLPNRDLDHVVEHASSEFEQLRGRRVFITGGTGFFGMWLLESFVRANHRLALNASAYVLTRSPESFCARAPHLAQESSVVLIRGDMSSFDFPPGEFSHVIHAATETGLEREREDPLATLESNLAGTRRVLQFVHACHAQSLLFTSSGAVYGPQPADLRLVPEDYPGAPPPTGPKSGYGEAKRVSEFMCSASARRDGFNAVIARCFAFVGPHLPLDAGYAVGNFVRDALAGGAIRVNGDGTPLRSYLYAADLAIWLWTILFRGESCRPYNVGSPEAVSIAELASEVAEIVNPGARIEVASKPPPGNAPARYVPCTARSESELGLRPIVTRTEGIRRMAEWYRAAKNAETVLTMAP